MINTFFRNVIGQPGLRCYFGIKVDGVELTLVSDVPAGHKVALRSIAKDEKIIKYGFPIGHATCDIEKGAHVHVHNVHTLLSGELYASGAQDPFQEGSVAIDVLIKKLNGEEVDPWTYTPTGPIYAADVDNYSWF